MLAAEGKENKNYCESPMFLFRGALERSPFAIFPQSRSKNPSTRKKHRVSKKGQDLLACPDSYRKRPLWLHAYFFHLRVPGQGAHGFQCSLPGSGT